MGSALYIGPLALPWPAVIVFAAVALGMAVGALSEATLVQSLADVGVHTAQMHD